jgi:vitamin B12 transporter
MSIRSATLFALAAGLPVFAADSATPPTPTPDLVVTADRRPVERDRTIAAVEVVDDQDDRERGRSLDALSRIDQLPGVTVVRVNGSLDGGVAEVNLRGSPTQYTQFLVDGLPVNDPTAIQGDRNPALIDPAGLDQVEVVKGTQSGLYGSRAIGGVVNFLTDRPTPTHRATVRGQGGTANTYDGEARATGPLGKNAGYAAAAQASTTWGTSSTTGIIPGRPNVTADGKALLSEDGNGSANERDGQKKTAGRLRLEGRPGDAALVYGSASGAATNADLDTLGNPEDPEAYKQDRNARLAAGAAYGDHRAPIEAALDAAYTWDSRMFRFGGSNDETYRADEYYAQGRVTGRPAQGLALTAGADIKRQYADFQGFSEFHESDSNLGLWGQAAWSTRFTEVSLTGRSDIPSTEQTTQSTGRLGVALIPIPQVKLRSAIANGFRAPSLYERYVDSQAYDFGFFFYKQQGNQALRTETTRQGEAGIDLMPVPGLTVSATAFRTLYDRRIDSVSAYDAATNTVIGTYANAEAYGRSDGIESSLSVDEPAGLPFSTRLWYTLTRSADDQGRPFVTVPLHSGGVSGTLRQFSGRWAFFQTAACARNTGYNLRDFAIGDHRNNDFNQVDAAVGTVYAEDYELSLRGENLLNDTTTANGTSSGNFTRTPMAFYVSAGATF